jgi:hypothetical protein
MNITIFSILITFTGKLNICNTNCPNREETEISEIGG